MQFSSMPRHANSGMSLYSFRGYDPTIQRWIQRDPIGEAGGLNLYGFVGNAPVNWVDAWGEQGRLPGEPSQAALQYQSILADNGPPPVWLTFVPMLGPTAQATYDYSQGHWIWGTLNAGVAVSDLIPARSLAGGLFQGLWKFGSHTWDATRKWLTRRGWRKCPGKEMHHWAIPQGGWGEAAPDWLKNQPWNLMDMPDAVFHDALHGMGEAPFNFWERGWYGTPDWLKAGVFSLGGREASWLFNGGGSGTPGSSDRSPVEQLLLPSP
jgi:RHS repeat-associated protein